MIQLETQNKTSTVVFMGVKYEVQDGIIEVPQEAEEMLKAHGFTRCEGQEIKRLRGRPRNQKD